MTHQDSHSKAGIPLGALAVGALAGALAGILLAPKSGKETRADIQKTMMKIKDDLATKLADMKDMTKEKYEQMISLLKEVDLSKIIEYTDETDLKEQAACRR